MIQFPIVISKKTTVSHHSQVVKSPRLPPTSGAFTVVVPGRTLAGCLVVVVSINWALEHFMGNKVGRRGTGSNGMTLMVIIILVIMILTIDNGINSW